MVRESWVRRRIAAFITAAVALLLPATVFGATYTWDSDPVTGGITGGAGTWSTSASGTNWWNGTANIAWPTNASDTAVFGATSNTLSTITVSGSVRAGGITFTTISGSGGFSVSGGTIGLADGATISWTNAYTSTPNIGSTLVGSNVTFTQTTGFNAWISGANSLTGTTTLNGWFGVWLNAMGSSAVVVQGPASTFDLMSSGTYANNFTISGTGFGGRGALRIGNQVSTSSQFQVLSGSITLAADATIRALGTPAWLGITGQIGETAGGAKNLTLDFQGTTPVFTLRGASTYSGTTTLTSGATGVASLILDGGDNRLPATTALTTSAANIKLVLGGTFGGALSQTLTGLTMPATGAVVGGASSGTSRLLLNIASGTNTFNGMLGGTAANENNLALTKSGAGMLRLSGSNTYTGDTTISGGTLALVSSTAALSSSGVVRVGSAGSSGATLDLTALTGTYTFGSNQTVAGIGTINFGSGKTVQSNGIWAPGNSIGSNAVTGNLSLSGTSQFELGTPGTSSSLPGTADFTSVSGTLTLGGNIALLDNSGSNSQGSYGAGAYRLFTAPTVSGSFASVTAPAGATTTRVGLVYGSGTGSGQGVFANVYNLASATPAQTINLGNTRVGTALTGTVTLTNSAPTNATYTETLSTGGFSNTSTGFTTSGSAGGIAGGGSGSGNLLVGLGTGLTAGAQTGTTTLALFSNAANSSGLAQQSITAQTITMTGGVYDFANAKYTGVTLDFGVVHRGASVSSQNIAFGNQTVTNASFQDLLDVSATTGNARVTATGFTGLAASASGSTTNNLAVSVSTATAGSLASTLSLTLTSNANGVAGLSNGTATVVGSPAAIATTGSVFSGNGIWNTNGGGTWGSLATGTNWTSAESVAAAPGTFTGYTSTDTATFGSAVTGGTATITLGSANPSLAALTFNSGSASYQLSGGTLGLNGGTSSALVTVSSGSHGIGSAVGLASNASIDVAANSLLTLSGVVSGSSAGLTKTGQGRLVLGGANTYTGLTQVSGSGSALAINGSVAGNVQVGTGAVLGGSGVIAGNLGGSGLIGPGNSPGILTVQGQLDATSTTAFAFELSGTGAPAWNSASASVNDVLRLTAASPFTSSLAATNIVNVYFDRASLANGDTFLGGFFVDNLNSTANLLTNGLGSAVFQYFVKGDGNGGYGYNGTNYYSLSQYMATNSGVTGVTQSVVSVGSANFTGGTITTGQVTQFVIVPEPGAVALALVGIAGTAGWSIRRHRRSSEKAS